MPVGVLFTFYKDTELGREIRPGKWRLFVDPG